MDKKESALMVKLPSDLKRAMAAKLATAGMTWKEFITRACEVALSQDDPVEKRRAG